MATQAMDGLTILASRRPGVVEDYLELLGGLGDALDARTRQLVLVALQAAHGSGRALRRHVPQALAAGATTDEVLDAIALALPLAGLTRVTEALAEVADLLAAETENAG